MPRQASRRVTPREFSKLSIIAPMLLARAV
jgi:hypothetical protein